MVPTNEVERVTYTDYLLQVSCFKLPKINGAD